MGTDKRKKHEEATIKNFRTTEEEVEHYGRQLNILSKHIIYRLLIQKK